MSTALSSSVAQVVDERFLPMRRETGTTVPWYSNETAIHSLNGAERNQALTLFKKLIFAWSRGAIGYTWYDLRNDGFDPVGRGAQLRNAHQRFPAQAGLFGLQHARRTLSRYEVRPAV